MWSMHFLNLSFSSCVVRGHCGQECQSSKTRICVYGNLCLKRGKKFFLRMASFTPSGSGWPWWNHAWDVATTIDLPVSVPKASFGTSWFLGTGALVVSDSRYSSFKSWIPPSNIPGSYSKRGWIDCLLSLVDREWFELIYFFVWLFLNVWLCGRGRFFFGRERRT